MTATPGQASRGEALLQRLDELAACSDEAGALTRLYLSPAHRRATLLVADWMRQAGMQADIDAVGNVVGRYEATMPGAPALLLGSHIDTVRDAGRYDGNFGALAAIAGVAALHEAGTRLPYAIEVLAFGDEEGVRFPATLTGSRAVAGTLDPAALDAADDDGVTVRAALAAFGGDPDRATQLGRDPARVLGYVELHIEQGPVLERAGLPVGVVTAISGASRLSVTVTGEAGHAGTVPMHMRRDALAAAAEMIGVVNRVGRETQGLVTTVGHIVARPNAVNIIAACAEFTIDIRSEEDCVRAAATARIGRALPAIAASHGATLAVVRTHEAPATPCASWLQDQLAAAVAAADVRVRRLPSGAGHDAMAMAALCPVGMLFVRCRGGVSHNPAESITAGDAGYALDVLGRFLHAFRPVESVPA
jgi:allantoate deiminase